jgi:hypothetical protein
MARTIRDARATSRAAGEVRTLGEAPTEQSFRPTERHPGMHAISIRVKRAAFALLLAGCGSHPHTDGPYRVRIDQGARFAGRGGEGMPSFASSCSAHVDTDPPEDVPLDGLDCSSISVHEDATGASILFSDDNGQSYVWENDTRPTPP